MYKYNYILGRRHPQPRAMGTSTARRSHNVNISQSPKIQNVIFLPGTLSTTAAWLERREDHCKLFLNTRFSAEQPTDAPDRADTEPYRKYGSSFQLRTPNKQKYCLWPISHVQSGTRYVGIFYKRVGCRKINCLALLLIGTLKKCLPRAYSGCF